MASLLGFAPLVVAALLFAVGPIARYDRDVDTTVTRVARRYFGRYVPPDAPDRKNRLRAAYIDQTYRTYAARTYLVTALYAVAGAVVGVYLTGGALLVLPAVGAFINELPDAMANALGRPELNPVLTETQVLLVTTAGGIVIGTVAAGLTYWLRWEIPRSRAEQRRRSINEGLPRTVAFVYALSRGGMEIPSVLRTLSRNRGVYGAGAEELSVAVREMDLFGTDIITAVRRVSARTPSEQFKTFSENLASVLQSGQSLSEFLQGQYERYREEAVERQEELLELLATIAEAYVTILVAGTLFLMTILLVFGLTTTQTIGFLRLLAYLLIPLGNVLFIVYLSGKLELLGVARGANTGQLREGLSDPTHAAAVEQHATDGGATPGADDVTRQLTVYDSVRGIKGAIGNPAETVLWNPTSILYLTVPLGLLWVAVGLPEATAANGLNVRQLDDPLIQATLFVAGTFAVVWEIYSRRISRMEAALPDLLDRLASLNQAGMSVVEGFERVRDSDLGALSPEVERIWRDLEYGANVDDALRRFGLRVRTTATTRVVTLLANAVRASGNLGPVLRIAADQAESELKLRRQRRQQMMTYLIVIYISFFVFLVIIIAVQEVLVPSLPSNVPTPSAQQTSRLGVDASQFARFGQVNKAAYTLVFFHTALIQAVLSGFIAGQLGEGSLKDGAKHAAGMLGIAYVAFVLLSSPVAQVTFADQTVSGDTVTVERVSVSEGGFVALRVGSADGEVIGHSDYLAPGQHRDVQVSVDAPFSGERELYAVPHLDTDADREFDYAPGSDADRTYPGESGSIADFADVERESAERVTRPPTDDGRFPSPDDRPAVVTSTSLTPRVAVGSL